MKSRYIFALLSLAVLALVAWAMFRPAAPVAVNTPEAAPAGVDAPAVGGPLHRPAGGGSGEFAQPGDEIELDPEAIASLRGAIEFGDPRTPPIGRSPPREMPTEAELADPEKYVMYEARQERKLKRSYVVEAEKYTQQLRSDIERGKAMGIPPAEIAKVQEKVRRIEAMRAQLLAEDPDLLDEASPVPRPQQRDMPVPDMRGPMGTADQP